MSGAYINFHITRPLGRAYAAGESLDVYEAGKRITVRLVKPAAMGDTELNVVPVLVESDE